MRNKRSGDSIWQIVAAIAGVAAVIVALIALPWSCWRGESRVQPNAESQPQSAVTPWLLTWHTERKDADAAGTIVAKEEMERRWQGRKISGRGVITSLPSSFIGISIRLDDEQKGWWLPLCNVSQDNKEMGELARNLKAGDRVDYEGTFDSHWFIDLSRLSRR